MQGSHFLVVAPNAQGQAVITAQGIVQRQVNKDGTHFLCRVFKNGYTLTQVTSLQQLESFLIFDNAQDLAQFMSENAAKALPAPAPAPPVDNEHVAAGCEQFSSPNVSSSTGEPTT